MQTFLVGGAVRDQLLGLSVLDRDYLVVGATPDDMLAAGYLPVGKDFPVFLHPITHEEYALARTERKQGHGYGGFTFYTSPQITIEEDLIRRDLTINAIAQNEQGELIDPYGGVQDLNNRVLKHVSEAFVEDPLRVLRVARFAARFYAQGFTIAPQTMDLMTNISQSGELQHLTPERVWKETVRALALPHAPVYFEVLRQCGALSVLFTEIEQLFGVPQRAQYHPEVDSGIHSLMSLQQACNHNHSLAVRWASLIHDLGKALTPKEELPRHIMHEVRGIQPVTDLCNKIKVPTEFKDLALISCKEHLLCHRIFELKAGTLWRLLQRLDVLRKPERVLEFGQVCLNDAQGRLGLQNVVYPQLDYLMAAANKVREVKVSQLPTHLVGAEIGEALINKRIAVLEQFKTDYACNMQKPASHLVDLASIQNQQ